LSISRYILSRERVHASPRAPRADSRRGALLWEVDPAGHGPALQELSLLGTWRTVGEPANLDRPALTVELDRQKPLGMACGAATRSRRALQCTLPRSSRRSGAWPASRPRDRRPYAAGSPDTPRAWSDPWPPGSTTSLRSQPPATCRRRTSRLPTPVHAHGRA